MSAIRPACWCCGQDYAEDELVRLGSRPEAAVCGRCARFLVRRARAQENARAPRPGASVLSVLDRSRDLVVEHGWHRLPLVGPVLRWVGDRLP